MIQISEYDFTQPSMRKAWKAEFRQYLIEYYKPSLVNADIIFNAITLVDSFVKKHTAIERKLLEFLRGKIPVPLQQDITESAQPSEYDIRKATEGLWKETSYFLRSRNRAIRNQINN